MFVCSTIFDCIFTSDRNLQTTLRLHWVIKNNETLSEAIRNKTAMFGTLDSWLLYKLRKGTVQNKYVEHISDITSCSATGFYDPFSLKWADWALKLFSINVSYLMHNLTIGSRLFKIFAERYAAKSG